MSKQLLAPVGLNAECVQVIVAWKPRASRELDLRPQGLRSSKYRYTFSSVQKARLHVDFSLHLRFVLGL